MTKKNDKILSEWAIKRERLLRKMELLIAEREYIKRNIKALNKTMTQHDKYLLVELVPK
jgi:hypothetical protein